MKPQIAGSLTLRLTSFQGIRPVYWDVNGGAATDAVLVAVLTGVTNLAASDFLIV